MLISFLILFGFVAVSYIARMVLISVLDKYFKQFYVRVGGVCIVKYFKRIYSVFVIISVLVNAVVFNEIKCISGAGICRIIILDIVFLH